MDKTKLHIYENIENELIAELKHKLYELDIKLTDKKDYNYRYNYLHPDFIYSQIEYYLSDGGYSRVCLNMHGKLFLTSNSLEKVKNNWHKCKDLIKEIEKICNDILTIQEKEFDKLF